MSSHGGDLSRMPVLVRAQLAFVREVAQVLLLAVQVFRGECHSGGCKAIDLRAPAVELPGITIRSRPSSEVAISCGESMGSNGRCPEIPGPSVVVRWNGDFLAATLVGDRDGIVQVRWDTEGTTSEVSEHDVHTCRRIGDATGMTSGAKVKVFWGDGKLHDGMVMYVLDAETLAVLWDIEWSMSIVDVTVVYVSTWDACCAWLDQMPALSTEIPFQLVNEESLVDEGVIPWKWSSRRGQVAAGWPLPKLCFGTLDHALDEYFLRRANITRVVWLLGAGSGTRSSSSPFRAAMEGRFRGIQYQSWSINHAASFWSCMFYFACWQHTMEAGGVILLHCKSGKDRSAFAAYMYLRLQLGYSHDEALECLSCRTTDFGTPLANIRDNWLMPSFRQLQCSEFGGLVSVDYSKTPWVSVDG